MTTENRYTAEQLEFLRTGYLSMNVYDLTSVFNTRFDMNKTESAIRNTLQRHKFSCGRKAKDRLISRCRIFATEQKQFIRDNYAGNSVLEMTAIFNNQFGTEMTDKQIRAFVSSHGISSGISSWFKKGHKSWNKGTKGLCKVNSGSFKKGTVPPNRKPIGTERICSKDGYILIKVKERDPHTGFQTRYKHKHVCMWEQEHGPVPKGKVVAFRDGDNTNIKPENLMLIPRTELLRLNKHGYKNTPAELKPSVLALAKLEVKTFARIKSSGDRSNK